MIGEHDVLLDAIRRLQDELAAVKDERDSAVETIRELVEQGKGADHERR